MVKQKNLGRYGEELSSEFLIKKSYEIIARNYRRPWGEIDIVSKAPDNTLVFVEVKTMKDGRENSLVPEDNLSKAKLTKLRRACEKFTLDNQDLIDDRRGWRIDLLAVSIPSKHELEYLTLNLNDVIINHYENI